MIQRKISLMKSKKEFSTDDDDDNKIYQKVRDYCNYT